MADGNFSLSRPPPISLGCRHPRPPAKLLDVVGTLHRTPRCWVALVRHSVVRISAGAVRLGITAPRGVLIARGELTVPEGPPPTDDDWGVI